MDAHVVHAGLCRPRRCGCSLEATPKPADSLSPNITISAWHYNKINKLVNAVNALFLR